MALPRDVLDGIRHYVWSGFYGRDEILTIICEEVYEPGELEEETVGAAVDAEFARKAAAEKDWPPRTDCDRLDLLFRDLEEAGIVALQNAGYTMSDGLEDVADRYRELGGKESKVEGYCFYHGQDLERAVRGEGLPLAFGDIAETGEKSAGIGRRIVDLCRKHGFQVRWNGSIKERILIEKLDWRRRGGAGR